MPQMLLSEAIKLNEIHPWHGVQDLPNDTQCSRWNEPGRPCSDSIADTKLVQIIHKHNLFAAGPWRLGYKPG